MIEQISFPMEVVTQSSGGNFSKYLFIALIIFAVSAFIYFFFFDKPTQPKPVEQAQ